MRPLLLIALTLLPAAHPNAQVSLLTNAEGTALQYWGLNPNGGPTVDLDGTVLVVGSPWTKLGTTPYVGRVTVLRWNGSTWLDEQELTSSDPAASEFFGSAVAVQGNTVFVGVPEDAIGGVDDMGSVRVFSRDGASWIESQVLTALGGEADDFFGMSLAVSGDVLVVGACSDTVGAYDLLGSARVFRLVGRSWVEQATLTPFDGFGADRFGYSVDIDGDVIVVGALFDFPNPGKHGSASVFRWNGSVWAAEQLLTAENIAEEQEEQERFGRSVSVSGDVIVVGAPRDSVFGQPEAGSATVFRWDGATWVREQYLVAGVHAGMNSGDSVSVSGDTIVLGAPAESPWSGQAKGNAQVYRWSGASWEAAETLGLGDVPGATTGIYADDFGDAVALEGGTAVVAIPGLKVGDNVAQGGVFVYGLDHWVDLGGGTTGIAGEPRLTMSGLLTPSSTLKLGLAGGTPSTLTLVFMSLASAPAPFLGGTLHTLPVALIAVVSTDATGNLHGSAKFPAAVAAGQELWFQAALADSSVPVYGASLSNAVKGTVP